MAMQTAAIPAFQLLAVASAAAVFLFAGLRLVRRQPVLGLFKAPPAQLVYGLLGVFGSNVLYLWALRLVPPASANIVSYTWPLMILGGGALLRWFKPSV